MSVTVERGRAITLRNDKVVNGARFYADWDLSESDAADLVKQLGALLDPKEKMMCLRCNVGSPYLKVRDERDKWKLLYDQLSDKYKELAELRRLLKAIVAED